MVNININATTPQLKLVKKWMEGYHSLNMDNVESHVSKNYKYQSCFDKAEEAKGEHSERYGKVLGSMTNLEVRAPYENCFQARRLIAPTIPRPMSTKLSKHRGRLSFTFVPVLLYCPRP